MREKKEVQLMDKKRTSSHLTTSCDEEHIRLSEIISKWNQERFSLFEISLPNENLEFFGVVRFFHRDPKGPLNSKCIKVSSADTCLQVTEVLVEKFRSDMKMLSNPEDFFLWEIFPNGERRLLPREEMPLLVQLNWNKDERDGYFLLEQRPSTLRHSSGAPFYPGEGVKTSRDKSKRKKWKRRLSVKLPKYLSKTHHLDASEGDSIPATPTPPLAPPLSTHSSLHSPAAPQPGGIDEMYSELQGMHLMRTLSNPEVVLKRRRERKMEQIREALKNPCTTALKIYAENLIPEVPYKTLLVTPEHTAHDVIRGTLEKYHMGKEDPSDFCLVQYSLSNAASCVTTTGRDECLLEPGDHPLRRYREHRANFPALRVIFQLRRLDQAIRPKIIPQALKPLPPSDSFRSRPLKGRQPLPCLLPMRAGKPDKQHRIQLYLHDFRLLVGSRRGSNQQADRYLALEGEDILPEHCVLEGYRGVCRLVPSSPLADVFVDHSMIRGSTPLTSSCVIRFGRHYDFQFCAPDPGPVRASLQLQQQRRSVEGAEGRPSSVLGEYRREGRELQRVLSDGAINEFCLQRLSLQEDAPETIFLSDGKVISLSNYSSSNLDDFLSEDLARPLPPPSRPLRSSARVKEEPLILPAMLSFAPHSAPLLADCFITDLAYASVSFQQAPAYALYLCARSFLGGDSQSAASLSQRLQSMRETLACACSLLKATVAQNRHIPGPLAFWVNNASELLHFLKKDDELSPHCADALAALSQIAGHAFKCLCESLLKEIDPLAHSLFAPSSHPPRPSDSYLDMLWKPGGILTRVPAQRRSAGALFAVLESVSGLMASCSVNREIARELSSRLLHSIDAHVLNQLLTTRSCAAPSALSLLGPRVKRVQAWGEEQGAGGGSLSFSSQAISLLECVSAAPPAADLRKAVERASKLSSRQIRTLLEMGDFLDTQLLQVLCGSTSDPSDPLLLPSKQTRPFKLPDSCYSSRTVLGLPVGLREFVAPAVQKGLCQLHEVSLLSAGNWVKSSDLATHRLSGSHSSVGSSSAPHLLPAEHHSVRGAESLPSPRGGSYPSCQEPARYLELELDKGDSDTIGISVVSCRLKNQSKSVILIKSVLDNPALADGRLERGDQIVEVDSVSLEGPAMTQERASSVLRATGRKVRLKILKKESVNLVLSTTNLYYSDAELSDSDSLPLSRGYPYPSVRPGLRASPLEWQRPPARTRQPPARYEEELSSPMSYYTQCPSFPRISRHSDYSLSPLPRDKQHSELDAPPPSHSMASSRFHTSPYYDGLYPPPPAHPLSHYPPPSYTLQLVPTEPPYGGFRHYLPHPTHYAPHLHLESGAESPHLHKPPEQQPSPTAAASKGELLTKLSQDEVELTSSISQREKRLQEVRANIEMLRMQEMQQKSLCSSPSHGLVADVCVREKEAFLPHAHTPSQLVGFHPSSQMQRHFSTTPSLSLYTAPHSLSTINTTPLTPVHHLEAPPDVIQSTLTASKNKSTSTDTFNSPLPECLPLSQANLAQPMSLQDKMDFFIHKSNS